MKLGHKNTSETTITFEFNFPTLSKPIKDASYIKPKHIKALLDALPLASPRNTARQLFDLLAQTNELLISPRQRFRLLEMIRQPVSYVIEAIESSHTSTSLPLSAENNQLIAASYPLLEQMAMGYKIILRDLNFITGRPNFIHRPLLRITAERAIYYLGQITYISYCTSTTPTAFLWCEIYSLYQLSVHNNITEKDTHKARKRSFDKGNITNIYKQILLLSINRTSRMRSGDINAIYPMLEQWVQFCSLETATYSDRKVNKLFKLQRCTNNPTPCTASDKQAHNDTKQVVWVLDTKKLSTFLKSKLQTGLSLDKYTTNQDIHNNNTHPHYLIAEILENLAEYENETYRERSTRIPVNRKIELSIGLFNICHYIEEIETQDIENVLNENKLIIMTEFYNSWISDSLRPNIIHQLHTCFISEESAGGCRIRLDTDDRSGIQAGTLIAFRHTSNLSSGLEPWTIGVVRWLGFTERTSLEAGVNFYAGNPQVFLATAYPQEPNQLEHQRILLLPPVAILNQPEIAIIPHGQFPNVEYLQLLSKESEILVKLGRCLEDTGLFLSHEVTRIQHCTDDENK